jgi:hypothetical protein
VKQTIGDCLHETAGRDGFPALLGGSKTADERGVPRSRRSSPLAHAIAGARPYAFSTTATPRAGARVDPTAAPARARRMPPTSAAWILDAIEA